MYRLDSIFRSISWRFGSIFDVLRLDSMSIVDIEKISNQIAKTYSILYIGYIGLYIGLCIELYIVIYIIYIE